MSDAILYLPFCNSVPETGQQNQIGLSEISYWDLFFGWFGVVEIELLLVLVELNRREAKEITVSRCCSWSLRY